MKYVGRFIIPSRLKKKEKGTTHVEEEDQNTRE
jgi:hypothetical protein